MKIFIDTANIEEIKELNSWGILNGVTTNPSLIAKEKKDFHKLLKEICEIVKGPISAEVISTDSQGMLKEARELVKIHKNIVIKIPLIVEGLKAVNILSSEGIKTNVTLCFSANQALLAAKSGATYISPFIGRIDDISYNGMELIKQIRVIYDNYGFSTLILAASIRHPLHMIDAAMAGADVATVPYKVLLQMVRHPLTDMGLKNFLADWEKLKK